MAELLQQGVLIDCVPWGSAGAPNMSPGCCILDDGTFLVAGVYDSIGGASIQERVDVWHIGMDGVTLGTYTYISDDWTGKDISLVAVADTMALLVVSDLQYLVSEPVDTTNVVLLNCAGATPVEVSRTASPFCQIFTGNNRDRFGFYDPGTDRALVHGSNGIVLYTGTGAYVDHIAWTNNSRGIHGVARHPTDLAKVAVNYFGTGVDSREFTMTSTELVETVHSEWDLSEEYWQFGLGSPYDSPQGVLEAAPGVGDADGWQIYDKATGAVLLTADAPSPQHYLNYSGPVLAQSPLSFVGVYEYDAVDAAEGELIPALTEVDMSTSPPTRSEVLLDWQTAYSSVSLRYGSWTMDYRDSVLLVVGASTTLQNVPGFTEDGYSYSFWVLQVKGAAPVEAVARTFDELQRSSASARLNLRKVIAAPVESVLNETPGKIVVDPGKPVPVRQIAIYPGERTEVFQSGAYAPPRFDDAPDPGLVQTWRGLPRRAQLSVIADTLCSTSGEFLSSRRDLPSEVELGTEVRWLAEEYDSETGRWGATLGSQQPWSWQGSVEKIELQYRKVRELFSFPSLSLDPGMTLISDFGDGEVTEMTVSMVLMPRYPMGYSAIGAGDGSPDWHLELNQNPQLGTWYRKVSGRQLNLALSTPLFATVSIKPPVTTGYLSWGPGRTQSFSVRNSFAQAIDLNLVIGKRQGEDATANFELLELSIDTYARDKSQVEELNALYGQIYGSA